MNPFFSIIIPVYNVEQYLDECICSILNQDFDDYEIILVNDGSTDNSGTICNKYLKNPMIHIIHKDNGGLSDARNTGMKEAIGRYLYFIDSDDYISPNGLSEFHKSIISANYPDVLITRLVEFYIDADNRLMDNNVEYNELTNTDKEKAIRYIFGSGKNRSTWPAQKYIVKRNIVIDHQLSFAKGYLHEDMLWTTILFGVANTFSASLFYAYYHRMGRSGSITTSPNVKRPIHVMKLADIAMHSPEINVLQYELRLTIQRRLVSSIFSSISAYSQYSQEDKSLLIQELKTHRHLLRYAKSLHHKAFVRCGDIFGYRFAMFIMTILN